MNPTSGKIPLRIANLTAAPQTIHKNTYVRLFYPVEAIPKASEVSMCSCEVGSCTEHTDTTPVSDLFALITPSV